MSAQPISEARLAANRANAQKSTGPKTPEGKAAVAGNALKHGLRSERNPLSLAHETALPFEHEEFLATLEALKEDMLPHGPLETQLVERLAQLNLRLNRAVRMETTHLNVQLASEKSELASAGIAPRADSPRQNSGLTMLAFLRDPNALTLIGRYESRLSREFARTLAQFHQLQKLRNRTQPAKEAAISTRSRASHRQIAEIATGQPTPPARAEHAQCNVNDAAQICAEQTQPTNAIHPVDTQLSGRDRTGEAQKALAQSTKQAA